MKYPIELQWFDNSELKLRGVYDDINEIVSLYNTLYREELITAAQKGECLCHLTVHNIGRKTDQLLIMLRNFIMAASSKLDRLEIWAHILNSISEVPWKDSTLHDFREEFRSVMVTDGCERGIYFQMF
jgi:hypothetical protein